MAEYIIRFIDTAGDDVAIAADTPGFTKGPPTLAMEVGERFWNVLNRMLNDANVPLTCSLGGEAAREAIDRVRGQN